MGSIDKAFKLGAKIFGNIAKAVGTCVIAYAAVCAFTAIKEYNNPKKKQACEEENMELAKFREKLLKKAEQNAAEDRIRIAQMHSLDKPQETEKKSKKDSVAV